MNLFEHAMERDMAKAAPLAARMRPKSLEEFEEQSTIVGPGTTLRRSIENDSLMSMIFFGPPGTGKTALANIIASMTKSHFETINAVMAGVGDIRRVVDEAQKRRSYYGEKTVLFIDEIHRFNKAQQDALLPFVENGLITLIGSTTENPMFSVNRPILSRSQLYRFELLSTEAIVRLLQRALQDRNRGLGNYNTGADPEALPYLAEISNGDARAALNALELAVITTVPEENGSRKLTLATVQEALQKRLPKYNQKDEHYDVVSAFIKSMRGSDPDATLYWLARLLYAGEDPQFISRRIMIHAAEDVGLADPLALVVAASAAQSVERVGLPEARIILAEAALYIARAPKSNSVVKGIDSAMAAVENKRHEPVPAHLRDASYKGAKDLGHGKGYKYPHDYQNHWVEQDYLPAGLSGTKFFEPPEN
ncbi:AAA ATPase central domain protein [Desulfofarcimen acetoxidans DSM 771]|uniref:Replication-associated recombination protein A n=1 Tax=Desulfofarcimen acetoxidans (strain ATCC 49208 / DSM 771 / KCTC 5769 / VKM B-1644 / 5575) TaxID=485916 RepID=C8W0Y7_DESAS|nr:replication-associated recombination protein A [Desulfofarcimen acetoxidans]ACV63383.1 AAA ATPase central domain protein [Desulfofarcimen acetoxidans DSM 771]